MRFDDPVFVAVAEPQQSGLFDRGSQQLVEFRVGRLHGNSLLLTSLHAPCRIYFREE
jgi:hypothetical protein